MPYLNWKTASLKVESGDHPTRGRGLTLLLGREALQELLPHLENAVTREGIELRLDLPEHWVIFWKNRPEESRVLLAHPQENEWVATVALDSVGAQTLLGHLGALESGKSVQLGNVLQLGKISNLELEVKVI